MAGLGVSRHDLTKLNMQGQGLHLSIADRIWHDEINQYEESDTLLILLPLVNIASSRRAVR
jgi:hypothetical protein